MLNSKPKFMLSEHVDSAENIDASVQENEQDTCENDECEDVSSVEELSAEKLEIERLKKALDDAEQKSAQTHDKMLRIAADAENLRKRFERESVDARAYAITQFARDLLPVIDAFDKAKEAIDRMDFSSETEEGKKFQSVCEGVNLVSKVFNEAISKHGVERLPGKGEPFNPDFHQAIAKEEVEDIGCDTVIEEFMPGYKINQRILRTAMVKVAVKS